MGSRLGGWDGGIGRWGVEGGDWGNITIEDIGYDGVEWCSRVSMEGVISFDVLLDVVDGYCDKVGG